MRIYGVWFGDLVVSERTPVDLELISREGGEAVLRMLRQDIFTPDPRTEPADSSLEASERSASCCPSRADAAQHLVPADAPGGAADQE